MTDDIVTRLRAYNIGNIGHEAASHMEETLYEAADEIERLRLFGYQWLEIGLALYYDFVCANGKPVLKGVEQYIEGRKQWDGKLPWASSSTSTEEDE